LVGIVKREKTDFCFVFLILIANLGAAYFGLMIKLIDLRRVKKENIYNCCIFRRFSQFELLVIINFPLDKYFKL